VNALAKHYSPLYQRELDPLSEITVSVGTSEVRRRSGDGGGGGGGVFVLDDVVMTVS